MIHLVSTLVTKDRYDPKEPDGWLSGVPYYLLNPRLHRESLRIDFGLSFVRYDVERGLDMYILEQLVDKNIKEKV